MALKDSRALAEQLAGSNIDPQIFAAGDEKKTRIIANKYGEPAGSIETEEPYVALPHQWKYKTPIAQAEVLSNLGMTKEYRRKNDGGAAKQAALFKPKGGRVEVSLKNGNKLWIDTNYGSGFQVAGHDGFGDYNPWQRMKTDNSDGVHSFVTGHEIIDFNTPAEALDFIKKQYGDDSFDSNLYDQVKDWKRD